MSTIYLPGIQTSGKPTAPVGECGMSAEATRLATLIRTMPTQRRTLLSCDDRLCRAARAKADDQAANGWWLHTNPNGESSNELVRRFGFTLPTSYDRFGNQVESLAYGVPEAETILKWLLASPPHRAHIAGEGFFGEQDRIGVGYAVGNQWPHLWVILTAPSI